MGMTNETRQRILSGAGYYNDRIDGKFGPASKAAARSFLADFLAEDAVKLLEGIVTAEEAKPASVWDGIKYFTDPECRCRCNGKFCDGSKEPKRELLEVADEIREEIGAPLIPTSVIRCEEWNALQPGAATNSRHKLGKAMDAWSPNLSAAQLLAIAQKNPRVRYAYAVDEKVVHFDVE